MKSNFGELKQSKNVILGNFGHSELRLLKNLGPENWSNLLKSKFRTSKIGKNNIFGLFEFTKIGFHAKSEWQQNYQIQQSQALTSHFESFWSIVHVLLNSKCLFANGDKNIDRFHGSFKPNFFGNFANHCPMKGQFSQLLTIFNQT